MAKERRIPVFPNWFPFNDMILDGHLRVGKYAGVKTRSWQWKYRGPTLFYNTLRTEQLELNCYPEYQNTPQNLKSIIGIAEIVDSRPLTIEEAKQMLVNFNNKSRASVERYVIGTCLNFLCLPEEAIFDMVDIGPIWVYPFRNGFFFQNLARFEVPFPFNWPSGPIKPIFVDINKHPALKKQIALAGF